MDDIAIAMGEVVDGRLSSGAPACRTSILARRQKESPTVYFHPTSTATPRTTSLKVTQLLEI